MSTHQETEEGQVIAGTLSAVVDGRRIRVGAGEMARFPVGSVHRRWVMKTTSSCLRGFVKPWWLILTCPLGGVRGGEQWFGRT